jgi:hypothetical protein
MSGLLGTLGKRPSFVAMRGNDWSDWAVIFLLVAGTTAVIWATVWMVHA